MTSPEELASMIRFALNELSGRNGHHEFEELSRHLARARIATNVIPATGPVGTAGDQGRDLETFRTYLAQELGPYGAFIARSTDDTIVFACTIQRDGLAAKIRADVDKIQAAGAPVDHIVTFLGGDLAVGSRHEVQADVRERFGVSLDVFDARAIAQELAQTDTFWIAERYLSLPAELAPLAGEEESPDWYYEAREGWQARPPFHTLADLLAIKACLRRSTFHLEQRADLPFWLALMRTFLDDAVDENLQRRAQYEVAVATLRGSDDLRPADEVAADFVSYSCSADDPVLLEDGSVLLMYCIGAFTRAKTSLNRQQLASWNQLLRERALQLLDRKPGPNLRARLLEISGLLNMQPDAARIEVPPEPVPDTAELVHEDLEVVADAREVLAHEVMVDVDAGMNSFIELTGLLDNAPMFPIERFANYVSVLTPLLVDHPLYRQLADAVDERVAGTAGEAAAAARCRDRAIALRRAERYTAALAEFHQAKVGWWSGDSLRGSLLSMFLIADCYEQLGFLHAAKHAVLLAARIAANSKDDDLQDLFAQGICISAHMDYGLGHWFSSAATAELGLILHSNLVAALDPNDARVERMMFELTWIYAASRDLLPVLAQGVRQLLERAGLWEEIDEITREVGNRTPAEWLEMVTPQLFGEWFADLKDEVRISFSGLGTTWTLVGDNESTTTKAMQRFASAAEVVLAELASEDLALLKTAIHVRVDVGVADHARAQPVASNEGRHWRVLLTPWTEDSQGSEESLRVELLAVLASILSEASLFPDELFMERIEEAFKRGLSHKIGFGPLLDELLQWTSDEEFEQLRPAVELPASLEAATYVAENHPELDWRDGPGPTYDQATALEAIALRYERVGELFGFTLNRLRPSPEFLQTVDELRAHGWRDWHILNSVASAATNYRLRHLGLDRYLGERGPKGDEARTAFQLLAFESETAALETVPLSAFSAEELDFNRIVGLPLFLQGVGLAVHQRTPDVPAIEHFLGERYGYWSDDIPHDDPFI